MQTTMNRITWRNGFRLNGNPALMSDVQSIFEERVTAKKWELYELRKAELREKLLSPKDFEIACRDLAELLGI
ncbi:hypothetical protein REO92_002975 [Citrobacter freundii]|jgi:hypothetical protein|uniref:hypothetical protein n=1 Tax=Citrobacter TaxID=544 RepID=UPI000FAD472B|nr:MULTISPECIES: hypothetical protein [Citrobacter]EAB6354584.1 hypothetical protein [Salmonella enterica subsp. enterica]EAM2230090.1 hypothetical protein [Salmonella enterica]EBS5151047.1 hypothetical protein [Salmonella enterica subsp. enterica serovar Monschaui]EFP0676040.1 hypothetical protein [Salmonella bongori]MDK2557269.1 hypothetical protein [Citrobacter youngae]